MPGDRFSKRALDLMEIVVLDGTALNCGVCNAFGKKPRPFTKKHVADCDIQ
jgi:hypothetical protein